jgi:hypothetical protein
MALTPQHSTLTCDQCKRTILFEQRKWNCGAGRRDPWILVEIRSRRMDFCCGKCFFEFTETGPSKGWLDSRPYYTKYDMTDPFNPDKWEE